MRHVTIKNIQKITTKNTIKNGQKETRYDEKINKLWNQRQKMMQNAYKETQNNAKATNKQNFRNDKNWVEMAKNRDRMITNSTVL